MIKLVLQFLSNKLLLLGVACLCALGVFMGVDNIREAQVKLDAVLSVNATLDRENRATYRIVQGLRSDRQAIEEQCRAELGLVRSDEIVYLLPKE